MSGRALVASLIVVIGCTSVRIPAHAADEWAPAEIQVPAGFTVEVAAAPPLVKHPMMAAFDDRGRLFIAESAGNNLRRADLEVQLPNFVRMIEDTDGDGSFDKSTIFADKMTFPMGALWHQGSLYVASSGGIWRLQDTDDDGVADVRELIVDEFGYTGNAADVHGCFLGPCGRIYWCEGRHGHEFRDDGGHVLSQGKAARIFSCKPDGSDVQVHCGGGMDNPVEIDFTETGEMLGTVNILYRQRGDCLVHWVHGGVYPRHDQPQVVAEFKRTGDLLPPVVNLGHVAVSGTTRNRGSAMGSEFQDDFFITEFNTHKVVRAKLNRIGSTYSAEVSEFLSCTSGDFHPTDVLEDADGSLLVIDTGGWFRIGCPTSQIAKPNILGAIYRIRRDNSKVANDPRGQNISWDAAPDQITQLLDDDRFAVRDRAIRELASRGDSAIPSLSAVASSTSERARRNAVWALSRIGSQQATEAILRRLSDENASVRQAVVVSLGTRGDQDAWPQLVAKLGDSDVAVQRDAATAIGKLKPKKAVSAVLGALSNEPLDRVHEHALIYALIDINAPDRTRQGLASAVAAVQRSSLIALDQMDAGNLKREEVTSLLSTTDLALQRVAVDIIARHPDWSGEVVEVAQRLLANQKPNATELESARRLLLAFVGNASVQAFIATSLQDPNASILATTTLLEVIRDSNLAEAPTTWVVPLQARLQSHEQSVLDAAVAASAKFTSREVHEALLDLAVNEKISDDLRVRAAAASSATDQISDQLFRFLSAQLAEGVPTTRRLAAARAIAAAKLNSPQLLTLTRAIQKSSPLELSTLLAAFEGSSDEQVGRQLVTNLASSPGLTSLSPALLDQTLNGFSAAVNEAANKLRSRITPSNLEQIARLAKLEPSMRGGDPRRGQAVFEGQRTSCVTCHAIRGTGGRIGPDLSTTGDRRSVRDILEAVLYPNSSLARGFESFVVVTGDGKIHTGLILSETTDAIRLRTTQQSELTIRRDEIEELQPSQISVMPTGLDQTMSDTDLRDLVAYLRSLTTSQ